MDERQKEVQRRIRIREHAELTGNAAKTCRYFGISRSVLTCGVCWVPWGSIQYYENAGGFVAGVTSTQMKQTPEKCEPNEVV